MPAVVPEEVGGDAEGRQGSDRHKDFHRYLLLLRPFVRTLVKLLT